MKTIEGVIDYKKDSLEKITKHEINRVEELLSRLDEETLLCSDVGAEAVAEYEFKGDLEAVKTQLRNLLNLYKKRPVVEEERLMLMVHADRLLAHRIRERKDFYSKQSREKLGINEGIEESMKYINAGKERKRVLHEKKECLCYCNGE